MNQDSRAQEQPTRPAGRQRLQGGHRANVLRGIPSHNPHSNALSAGLSASVDGLAQETRDSNGRLTRTRSDDTYLDQSRSNDYQAAANPSGQDYGASGLHKGNQAGVVTRPGVLTTANQTAGSSNTKKHNSKDGQQRQRVSQVPNPTVATGNMGPSNGRDGAAHVSSASRPDLQRVKQRKKSRKEHRRVRHDLSGESSGHRPRSGSRFDDRDAVSWPHPTPQTSQVSELRPYPVALRNELPSLSTANAHSQQYTSLEAVHRASAISGFSDQITSQSMTALNQPKSSKKKGDRRVCRSSTSDQHTQHIISDMNAQLHSPRLPSQPGGRNRLTNQIDSSQVSEDATNDLGSNSVLLSGPEGSSSQNNVHRHVTDQVNSGSDDVNVEPNALHKLAVLAEAVGSSQSESAPISGPNPTPVLPRRTETESDIGHRRAVDPILSTSVSPMKNSLVPSASNGATDVSEATAARNSPSHSNSQSGDNENGLSLTASSAHEHETGCSTSVQTRSAHIAQVRKRLGIPSKPLGNSLAIPPATPEECSHVTLSSDSPTLSTASLAASAPQFVPQPVIGGVHMDNSTLSPVLASPLPSTSPSRQPVSHIDSDNDILHNVVCNTNPFETSDFSSSLRSAAEQYLLSRAHRPQQQRRPQQQQQTQQQLQVQQQRQRQQQQRIPHQQQRWLYPSFLQTSPTNASNDPTHAHHRSSQPSVSAPQPLDVSDLPRLAPNLPDIIASLPPTYSELPRPTEILSPAVVSPTVRAAHASSRGRRSGSRLPDDNGPSGQHRPSSAGERQRQRSRRVPSAYITTPDGVMLIEEDPKMCCTRTGCRVCMTYCLGFRKVLMMICSMGAGCMVSGAYLIISPGVDRSFLTLGLMFVGLGLLLVAVAFLAWKCTPSDHEPFHLLFGLGSEAPCHCRHGRGGRRGQRRNHTCSGGGILYPEFRYRRPPPSYNASMDDYNRMLRVLTTSNHAGSVPSSGPPSYKSHATLERPAVRIVFPPRSNQRSGEPPPPAYQSPIAARSLRSDSQGQVAVISGSPGSRGHEFEDNVILDSTCAVVSNGSESNGIGHGTPVIVSEGACHNSLCAPADSSSGSHTETGSGSADTVTVRVRVGDLPTDAQGGGVCNPVFSTEDEEILHVVSPVSPMSSPLAERAESANVEQATSVSRL